jgi:phosphatidate phosphatase APP1
MEIEPKEFWGDMKWGKENYSELMRKYPERWVAIVAKKVVGIGRSMSEAEKEAHKNTGVDIKNTPVRYLRLT